MNRLFLVFLLIFFLSCNERKLTEKEVSQKINKAIKLNQTALVPLPKTIINKKDSFVVDQSCIIYFKKKTKKIAKFLESELESEFDLKIDDEIVFDEFGNQGINLILRPNDDDFDDESYKLEISEEKINLKAKTEKGLFYGIQTLLQAFLQNDNDDFFVPCGIIDDCSRFSYRGFMLDVARYFYTVEEIKDQIDIMARYKLNYLHLHLTDDQGWRIEINKYPRLTEYAGMTKELGSGNTGYYTQEDFKEIQKYAMERYIIVIPEIDMPGHISAAGKSYPELNAINKSFDAATQSENGWSAFCVRNEFTYTFIDDVIKEVAAITDGPYLHIGGDEAFEVNEIDYCFFMEKAKAIVHKNHKIMIGWDEIAISNVTEQDIIQYWVKPENAEKAIEKGCKLIMSPCWHTYYDIKYNEEYPVGDTWCGITPVNDSYEWDPTTMETFIKEQHILGVEGCLWTGRAFTTFYRENLTYPRLLSLAEIGWTLQSKRDWYNFKKRLSFHNEYFKRKDIDFYKSPQINWKSWGTS